MAEAAGIVRACEIDGQLEAEPPTRGVAPIKVQYLTTKDDFYAFLEKEHGVSQQCVNENITKVLQQKSGDDSAAQTCLEEPSAKKAKLDDAVVGAETVKLENDTTGKEQQKKKRARGQNKKRPHMKPSYFDNNKLCPSVSQESEDKCLFGDKCKFIHDIPTYLKFKPDDLGDRCYLYETFGKCKYGITCRFSKAHIGDHYKNLVNEEVVKKWEGKNLVKNTEGKTLQRFLRKKKFVFEKSEQYLKHLKQLNKADTGKEVTVLKDVSQMQKENVTLNSGNSHAKVGTNLDAENGVCAGVSINSNVEDICKNDAADADVQTACQKKTLGTVTDEDIIKVRSCEKKRLDFRDKLYLAPLTTCGNLPFRRLCKRFGADITCGEMAVCTNLLQGQSSEWALLKRYHTEDIFGVQLEGAFPDTMTKCAELLSETIEVDFVDINVGCPIDLIYNKGGGCGLMNRMNKFEQIVKGMNSVLDVPLTVKIRTGVQEKVNITHKIIPHLKDWGISLVTLHGRSREQRYTKQADWDYIDYCSKIASPMPLFGNGDILSFEDANRAKQTGVSGVMIARGALIKPWIFTEIKEQRHWDISSAERFDILRDYTNYGLEHWGADTQGVEKTRKFMLEWLSFLHRYIPVGLLEHLPQKINERPPYYMGRDYMETLMASQNVSDWIKISEMLLGPVPSNFTFLPKHKANAYK